MSNSACAKSNSWRSCSKMDNRIAGLGLPASGQVGDPCPTALPRSIVGTPTKQDCKLAARPSGVNVLADCHAVEPDRPDALEVTL